MPMRTIEVAHWSLVQRRAQIRHDKEVALLMRRCWRAALQSVDSPTSLDRSGFELMYQRLLVTMTVGWDDATFKAIADAMWRKDFEAFDTMDQERFSCSLFAFSEMWVDSVDTSEYIRVLELVHRILSENFDEPAIRCSSPTSLDAFLDALRREQELRLEHICIGKSMPFDFERYTRVFGSEIPHLSAADNKLCYSNRRGRYATALPFLHEKSLLGINASHLRPRSCLAFVRVDESHRSQLTKSDPLTKSSVALALSKRRDVNTIQKVRRSVDPAPAHFGRVLDQ